MHLVYVRVPPSDKPVWQGKLEMRLHIQKR